MHSIKYTIVLRVLAVMNLLGLCFAAPVSTVASPGTITSITYDPAATTPPATTLPATTLPAPDKGNFVVTVINSHTAAISTKHDQGPNAPTAIRENNVGDIVKPGETFSFAVPTGVSQVLQLKISICPPSIIHKITPSRSSSAYLFHICSGTVGCRCGKMVMQKATLWTKLRYLKHHSCPKM